MQKIAAIIFENCNGELLLYLRDNKPGIPFPGHWDLIGGHVEENETPEDALKREVKEELNINLENYSFFREYLCLEGDAYPNVKYIYSGCLDIPIEKITLLEGDHARYFTREEITSLKFANILRTIVMDYLSSVRGTKHVG